MQNMVIKLEFRLIIQSAFWYWAILHFNDSPKVGVFPDRSHRGTLHPGSICRRETLPEHNKLENHGKSPSLIGKSTISMTIFSIAM